MPLCLLSLNGSTMYELQSLKANYPNGVYFTSSIRPLWQQMQGVCHLLLPAL